MPMTTDGFPVATTPAPGIAGGDWEVRVDFERLRTYRLNRTREALEASDLGALLLFDTSNIRYVTATQIGYWAFNKGERYAPSRGRDGPRFDFGRRRRRTGSSCPTRTTRRTRSPQHRPKVRSTHVSLQARAVQEIH
jgi:Xaa-Pro dipeptidase